MGTEVLTEVERIAEQAGSYRLKLPTDSAATLLVTLEFTQTAKDIGPTGAWAAPRLKEGAIVQESSWELRVPENLAILGVPADWSDANQWVWSGFVFKRRPATSGRGSSGTASDGTHAYLFGRVGEPTAIAPMVVSRASLVGVCSGVLLAVGLLLMSVRQSSRMVAFGLVVLLLAAIVAVPPSVVPQVAQSSVLGLALLMIAVMTQRVLEKRSPHLGIALEPSGLRGNGSSLSSRIPNFEVGSEGSTVIKTRAGTTVDHVNVEVPDGTPVNAAG